MKRLAWILVLILALTLSACSGYETAAEDAGEALTATHRFERLADAERSEGGYITARDGADVVLTKDFSEGIPYEHESILFDPLMFTATEKAKSPALSDAVNYEWRFVPLAAGESEIMMLTRYLVDDSLECLVLHVIIDEELNCRVDWYETGVVGVNYALVPYE